MIQIYIWRWDSCVIIFLLPLLPDPLKTGFIEIELLLHLTACKQMTDGAVVHTDCISAES